MSDNPTAEELARFHQLCNVSLLTDENEENPILCVSLDYNDVHYRRCVHLQPLMEMLADGIRSYHDKLHAEPGEEEEENLPPGEDPMQVEGWASSIRHTARRLAEKKAVKSLFSDLKKAAKSRRLQAVAVSAVGGPGAGLALTAAYKAHDALVAAKAGNPQAAQKLKNLAKAAADGNSSAMQTLRAAAVINNKMKEKEAQASEQVSGWLYNRPYRTTAEVITAPLRGQFPTVSLALRQGWHDGMNFAKTMHRRPLFNLGG